MLLWIVFILAISIWTIKKTKNYFRTVFLALNTKGPLSSPILHNVLRVKDDKDFMNLLFDFMTKPSTSLPGIWFFCVPFFGLIDPEDLKIVLNSSKLSRKNIFYQAIQSIVGDGLITLNDEKWRRHRRVIQPYFQPNFLENYFETFIEYSEELVKSLNGKNNVKITEPINTCVLNILHSIVLGVPLKKHDKSPFRGGEMHFIKKVSKPWLLLDSVFKLTDMSIAEKEQNISYHQYVNKVLDERIKQKQNRDYRRTCLLDLFIKLSETSNFSQKEITEEAVSFMLAGQDSAAGAIAFCLYYIAKNQDVQEKVFREIDELVYGENLKSFTIAQINRMRYLEQCIKETERLAPSAPVISRVLTSDVKLSKCILPSGTNILISPFITHRLPQYFPNPLRFDPDRFSQENINKIIPFSYIPFSAGPRNCIAAKYAFLKIKTIVATILRSYHLAVQPGYEDLSFGYKVTLRAKEGIWLQLKPRERKIVE